MDSRELTVTEQLAAAPRTSVDKLEDALEQLASTQPDDAGGKLLLGTFRSLLPTLRRHGYVPNDPAELDALLLMGARFMLGLRSDTAWQPESIDDLFLGPPAPPDAPQEG